MKLSDITNTVPLRLGVLAAAASLGANAAVAAEWDMGAGWKARLDSEITTGFQVRTEGRDCRIISQDNGGCAATTSELMARGNPGAIPDFNYLQMDSGNLNYDKGDMVSWVVKGTHDLSFQGPDRWAALFRGNWASDLVAVDEANFGLQGEARDVTRLEFTLLDAWVSKGFRWFDQDAKIRVGNQVLSWGEDIWIIGGINSINAYDLRKLHTPGTAVKEIVVPAPMAYLNTGITDDLSAEAYYQFMWNGFRFDPAGSFFSTGDFVGAGAFPAFVPSSIIAAPPGTIGDEHNFAAAVAAGTVVPRLASNDPSDQGQFGVTLRYQLGDAEIAAHYTRYHDKIPQISYVMQGGIPVAFFHDYAEDRDLFGVSGNMPVPTSFGDIVFGAEVSFRPHDTVGIDPTVVAAPLLNGVARGYTDEKKWQAHLTANYLFSPDSPMGQFQEMIGGTDGWFLFETAFVNYPGLDESGATPYFLPNYSLPDSFSMGYVAEVGMTFPHIWGTAVNFTPFVDFMHDVYGTSPNALPFVEGRKSLALNLGFNYLGRAKANFVYAAFWGGDENNLMIDRDFIGASFTYSF